MKSKTLIYSGAGLAGAGLLAWLLWPKKDRVVNWAGKTGWDLSVKGMGIRRNNPGNIREHSSLEKLKYPGWMPASMHPQEAGFAVFRTFNDGCAAILILLGRYISNGTNTIRKIISKYAPPTENKTSEYVERVARWTKIPPDAEVSIESRPQMRALCISIARQESGMRPDKADWVGNHNFNEIWNIYQKWRKS